MMVAAKQRVNRIIQQLYKNRIFRMGEVIISSTNNILVDPGCEVFSSSYNVYFTEDDIIRREIRFFPIHGRFIFTLYECLEGGGYRSYVKSFHDNSSSFKMDFVYYNNPGSSKVQWRNYCSWENNCISEWYIMGKDETYEQFTINVLFLNYLFLNKRYDDMRLFIRTVEVGKNLDIKPCKKPIVYNRINPTTMYNDIKNQTTILKQMRSSKVLVLQFNSSGGGVGGDEFQNG